MPAKQVNFPGSLVWLLHGGDLRSGFRLIGFRFGYGGVPFLGIPIVRIVEFGGQY